MALPAPEGSHFAQLDHWGPRSARRPARRQANGRAPRAKFRSLSDLEREADEGEKPHVEAADDVEELVTRKLKKIMKRLNMMKITNLR